MTVREKGVVDSAPFTTSFSPAAGSDRKLSSTVWGSRRTLLVSVKPPESVAVSLSSRYEGYSWSGAVNVPLATPENVSHTCSWQVSAVGQWCTIHSQDSAEAGSAPSSPSLALPEKEISWPTFQVEVGSGVSMVAVGGLLPAVMVSGSSRVSDAPRASVTLSPTA